MLNALVAALLAWPPAGAASASPPLIIPPAERPLVGDSATRRARGGPALAFELRGGIGTGEYSGSSSAGGRDAGASWRAQLGVAPLGRVAIFGAYSRSGFGCTGGFCAESPVTFTSSGFELGATLHLPIVWLQAAVLRHELQADWRTDSASREARADASLGVAFGAGAALDIGGGFALVPGVRYLRYGADFDGASGEHVAQWIGDVGVRYRWPLRR